MPHNMARAAVAIRRLCFFARASSERFSVGVRRRLTWNTRRLLFGINGRPRGAECGAFFKNDSVGCPQFGKVFQYLKCQHGASSTYTYISECDGASCGVVLVLVAGGVGRCSTLGTLPCSASVSSFAAING